MLFQLCLSFSLLSVQEWDLTKWFCHHLVFTWGLKENSGWTECNDLRLKVSQKSMYFVWQSPHGQKLRNVRFIDRSSVYSKLLIELAFCTRELSSLLFCFLVSLSHFTSSPPASAVSLNFLTEGFIMSKWLSLMLRLMINKSSLSIKLIKINTLIFGYVKYLSLMKRLSLNKCFWKLYYCGKFRKKLCNETRVPIISFNNYQLLDTPASHK